MDNPIDNHGPVIICPFPDEEDDETLSNKLEKGKLKELLPR